MNDNELAQYVREKITEIADKTKDYRDFTNLATTLGITLICLPIRNFYTSVEDKEMTIDFIFNMIRFQIFEMDDEKKDLIKEIKEFLKRV